MKPYNRSFLYCSLPKPLSALSSHHEKTSVAEQSWKSVSILVDINLLQQTEGDVCYKGPKITAGVYLGAARLRRRRTEYVNESRVLG